MLAFYWIKSFRFKKYRTFETDRPLIYYEIELFNHVNISGITYLTRNFELFNIFHTHGLSNLASMTNAIITVHRMLKVCHLSFIKITQWSSYIINGWQNIVNYDIKNVTIWCEYFLILSPRMNLSALLV